MVILIVLIFIAVFFLCLGTVLFVYLIGRKKGTDYAHLTETEKSWLARFADLNDEATLWWNRSAVEKWNLCSRDGLNLVADFVPCEGSHRYAVCIHGYTGDRREMRKYAAQFAVWRINTLLPDNRAHGESGGRWMGMGRLDSLDVQEWIRKIVERDKEARIFLFGVSMGGATVMMASGLDLPENVRFYVEDCGYTSAWAEFSRVLQSNHIPAFPLIPIASAVAKLFAGYSFSEASSLDALKKNKRPILFIHGTTDTFVPYDMLDQNVAASVSEHKEVLRVEGAGHALAVTKAKKEYFSAIKQFVDNYLV